MGFWKVFAISSFAFEKVGDCVKAEAVDAHIHPVVKNLEYGLAHLRVVEVQIRLVRIKTMPVVGFRNGVVGPVGCLEILKDYAGF